MNKTEEGGEDKDYTISILIICLITLIIVGVIMFGYWYEKRNRRIYPN
jgi:hypothetical protein